MKFKATREHVFWWPVKVKTPATDPVSAGKMETSQFLMQFVARPQDEMRKQFKQIAELPAEEQIAHENDMLLDACRNWNEDVVNEDGSEIPFSRERLADLMQVQFFRAAVMEAYQEAMSGDGARIKN